MFTIDLVTPDYDIVSKDTKNGRFYRTPEGLWVPSVTTKLSAYFDKADSLQAWRDRVGEAEARKITNQGKKRGDQLHKLVENYVLGLDWKRGVFPHTMSSFLQIKNDLDTGIDRVLGVEIPLYENKIKTGGRSDLFCIWKGKKSIVDIKTSRYDPIKEWIKSYFVQTTCYGHMIEQRNLVDKIEQVVILMACDYAPRVIYEEPLTEVMRNEMIDIMTNTTIELPEDFDGSESNG